MSQTSLFNLMPERRTWKVSELTARIRELLESALPEVWVEGEVSNCHAAQSGHCYFTLKDARSQIRCVCFRDQMRVMKFKPEDGLHITVRGALSVYDARGEYQIYVTLIEPVGLGALQLAFEQLKKKLELEGLFATARKKPLPVLPRCIGVVTSPTGAAIRDILRVLKRRFPNAHVSLYPVKVQGAGAATEIVLGLQYFNRMQSVDVLILARGGGSLEDLWAFNEEPLARAIFASVIPVITGVGHETDFTIADFVADLRAPTPSAAAELLTEAQHKVEEHLEQLHRRLNHACRYLLMRAQERYSRLSAPVAFARIRNSIARRQQRVDELQYQLDAAWHRQSRQLTESLQKLEGRLLRQDVSHRMRMVRERLATLDGRIARAQQQILLRAKARHTAAEGKLQTLSPLAVLNRGYALVFNEAGVLVREASAAPEGVLITTRFAHSTLTSRVTNS